MLDLLTIVYLFYAFIAFYFLFLYLMIYVRNRKNFYIVPEITRNYSLSIVVPCYNEEECIGETIQSLLDSDYKGLKKIIVVDDCSKDNSYKIMKKYARKYKKVMVVQTPKNTGKASGAKNYGAKFADTTLIGFVDADSYAKPDAISKMIGFFDGPNVAAVTSSILVKKRKKFIEKLQSIEYKIIVFTRKILNFVDAIYVTPGPLAIYRKKLFDKVGRFDEENLTEDIEITWNLVSKGYGVEMSTISKTHTVAPDTLLAWYRQRVRWNVGGLQTINKYKKTFFKKGMLGSFILPFFVLSWIVGIIGLSVLGYRAFRRVILYFLSAKYSIGAQTAILSLREMNLTPNVLIFFGTAILIFALSFTLIALSYTREKDMKNPGPVGILVYSFIYLLAYPLILVTASFKFVRGKKFW